MSDLNDDPFALAEAEGLTVVIPGPYDLQIDIDDGAAALQRMSEGLEALRSYYSVTEMKRTTSRGGGTHVYLAIDGIDLGDNPILRCALQACLGSDVKRELLSILRVITRTNRPPTLFFEKE